MRKTVPNEAKTEWLIFCPACKCGHLFRIPLWTFNGDQEKPTFRASMMVRGYEMSPEGEAMVKRGERPPAGQRYPGHEKICHSFVTDGKIQFLDDSTHALRGQTVDLPEI